MSYSVKTIFFTVQGEGAFAGRPSIFLRFAGCNLWNGLEAGRDTAICRFCDTDFVGMDGPSGGRFTTAAALADRVQGFWPRDKKGGFIGEPWVVCTGGEPLLQLDAALIEALHAAGLKISVETNGTITAPPGIDWLCVSPKANAPLLQTSGDELKLVYPQDENRPEDFMHLDFQRFSLQPRDDSYTGQLQDVSTHANAAFDYCLRHPKWSLSLQTHKWIGVP